MEIIPQSRIWVLEHHVVLFEMEKPTKGRVGIPIHGQSRRSKIGHSSC